MIRTLSFLLCFIVIVFIGCSKGGGADETPGGGAPGGGGTPPPSCTGTPGPLFNQVRAILQTNCAIAGCHSGANAQNGLNFSENCTIVSQSARVKVRAVDEAGTPNQMPQPPNPALSTADRQKIVDWITAGARITD